jgi:serine/threonine protein kinase
MICRTLAHYEIIEKIGAGGMGEVYRARDQQLDRDVALKLLPEAWSSDSSRLSRFEREAKVLASLNHPHIAAVYGFHTENHVHFIAMELLEGETLASSIVEGGLSLDRLLEIGIPLADAIAFAHDKGVIHRDLKPSNVMLDASGRIRVLDFGVAGLRQVESDIDADATLDALTGVGEVVGTVAYMPPEQLEGRIVDARADVFSIGVVLYELATGKRPFRADSTAGLISTILRGDFAPLTEVRPDLPADLARVVRRCLEKKAERRMQTAADVRNELEDLQAGMYTDEPSRSVRISVNSQSPAEHRMVITTEHVRQLSTQIPRMIGDSMTYLDNERNSDVLVFFLHGIGGDQDQFGEILRQTPFRAVAPSLYGFGQEARVRPPLHFTDHNLLVAILLKEVGRRVRPRIQVLVGHSSGADQMLRIVASEEGERVRPDGLILGGLQVRPGAGFVSGPLSRLTDDPTDILNVARAVAAAAEDLDTWLHLHDYLVRALGKFGKDTDALRTFAQELIAVYGDDEFFELFRTVTERVQHVRCVFSSDEREDVDYVLERHIGDNVLGDRYSEEMIVMESVGHVQLRSASILLPYVEEIVQSTRG